MNGIEVGTATYGENSEWGIDRSMNGFEGDLEALARELGCDLDKLKACFHDEGVAPFCELVGFEHAYMLYPHESQMPPGVHLMSEFA